MSTGILAEIVDVRREWVEKEKARNPLSSFQSKVTSSDRSFHQALIDPRPAFILECKKASPSKGLIRPDFDIEVIADTYGKYASAISVLTEHEYFQGSFENLEKVRQRVGQPALCKDFFFDPYQVWHARRFGADAILLIMAILDDHQYIELRQIAEQLGMSTLTEVSTEEELQRAIELQAPIVGINNRNLRDMSIDLERTRDFAPRLSDDVIIISESGFYTNQQIRDISPLVNGFLVGSSLMEEQCLDLAIRKLILGENKVCGLTRREDAVVAAAAGAVYGGLIFAPKSPRYVTPDNASDIMNGVDALHFVGVFQNEDPAKLAQVADQLSLHAVQLHGNEDDQYIHQLRNRLSRDIQIWKATSVEKVETVSAQVDRVLVDNLDSDHSGGTGTTFDWTQLPNSSRDRLILAGGLGPDNAADAAKLGCRGLDFNSGVESSPGIKNEQLIKQTFSKLREY